MANNLNFKSFGNEPPGDGGGGGNKALGNIPLTRQTSIYSLTFDELQSTMGGIGKDFGSMNMDELLKNIWSAEETQAMASSSIGVGGGGGTGIQEGLQRQGSLTLPRTLSQKTVDEVWKDISKEYSLGKDGSSGGGSNMPQRQQTLGEMTLEEFLVRAGVVREDTQVTGKVNNGGFFGDLSHSGNNNTSLGIGYQQATRVSNMVGSRVTGNTNQISIQPSMPLNVNGFRSSNQQQQPQQQPIYPKQPNFGYGTQIPFQSSTQLGMDAGGFVQSGALPGGGMGVAAGLGGGPVGVATGSPVTPLSSDGIGKSNGDTSSVSPVPYMFSSGLRGRKSTGAVEKVAERRQRRMIKNRESAARSRARKQAYTMELEAEVAKLKEENEELRRKQAEIMEMQKNQAMEMMNQQGGPRKRLRRTQTGPW